MNLTTLLLLLLMPMLAWGEDRYRVSLDEGLTTIQVEACFDGAAPRELRRHRDAADFTAWIRGPEGAIANRDRHGRLALGTLAESACVAWQVDLDRAAARRDYRLVMRAGDAIVSDADLWFWRDNDRRPIRVEMELPAGLKASVPWQHLPATGTARVFRPAPTPAAWSARIALGRFATRRPRVSGTVLRLAVLGADDPAQVDRYETWIREAADSVAAVTGTFPQHEPQVLVLAQGRQGEAVPWAHVVRGGGVALEFFVDGSRSIDALRTDWTATHEFSHLLLPFVSSRDRWLSEGLASYYQNVLRARDGRLDEQRAWEKLDSGFERGQRATTGGTLAGATQSGWGTTMRVYWSGAAMMLMADARLRALSGGTQSLDSALAALRDCCHDVDRSWRARELFDRLDRLTGYGVFTGLYDEHVMDEDFPDLSDTYEQLGLVPGSRGLRLDPDAPWSRIRHFIMNSGSGFGHGTHPTYPAVSGGR